MCNIISIFKLNILIVLIYKHHKFAYFANQVIRQQLRTSKYGSKVFGSCLPFPGIIPNNNMFSKRSLLSRGKLSKVIMIHHIE